MRNLLDRTLTSAESYMKDRLLLEWGQRSRMHIPELFGMLASKAPEEFAAAAMSLLDTHKDLGLRRILASALLEDRLFITYVTTPKRFPRAELVEFFRELQKADPRFDTKLAQLLPRRYDDSAQLDTTTIVAVLDILGEISVGPRLVLLVKHLSEHADDHIASKAFFVLGSRLHNRHWLKRSLERANPRARANLVESLWGDSSPNARHVFELSVNDTDNRVAGNGVVGMYLANDPAAEGLALKMLGDERPPFRWTAAWVLARSGNVKYLETLATVIVDPDPGVRRAAEVAIQTLEALLAKPEPPAEVVEVVQPEPVRSEETADERAKVAADPEFSLRLDGGLSHRT